jgi:hypothetical protein
MADNSQQNPFFSNIVERDVLTTLNGHCQNWPLSEIFLYMTMQLKLPNIGGRFENGRQI